MPHIRIMAAAAATAIALAFVMSPAAARSCDNGNESCVEAARRTSPMKLEQFMKTWKPVAKRANVSKRAKKSKTAPRSAAKKIAEPAVAETAPPSPPSSELENAFAATPEKTIETDGVAITSFDDLNELDASADHVQTANQAQTSDQVQVVAFNEVNEIDLAAPPPRPASFAETTGQATVSPEVSSNQTPADTSWIGKLLLAFAGTIAVAGATRLLLA